jgi:hypothetical protein
LTLPQEATDGKTRRCEGPAEKKILAPEIDQIRDGAGPYEAGWFAWPTGRRGFSAQQDIGVRFELIHEEGIGFENLDKSEEQLKMNRLGLTLVHGIGL